MTDEPQYAHVQQFITDVMTAAGLIRHGKQCKALSSRLSAGCMQFYEALAKASPLSISAEKVRFENWVKSEGYRIVEEDKDYPYRYSTDEIEGMWQAWQAAQSSPATPASQERAGAGKDAALTDEQILDAIAKVCAFDRVLASSGGELKHFLSPVQS